MRVFFQSVAILADMTASQPVSQPPLAAMYNNPKRKSYNFHTVNNNG